MIDVRVQGPDGVATVSLPEDATLADLRQEIATACGVPASAQALLSGFPPTPITASDDSSLSSTLGPNGARVLVRRMTAPATGAGAGPGAGGRRKPQNVQRRPVGGSTGGGGSSSGDAAAPPQPAEASAADDDDDDESAADAAAAPQPSGGGGGGGRKRKAGAAPARINPNADPLALTLQSEAARQKMQSNGGGGGGGSSSAAPAATTATAAAPRIKARSPEQLAADYYTSSGSAISAAARGGGKTGDFLSEHGAIEHRVSAVSAHKYELQVEPPAKGKKAAAAITATFKGVRKPIVETVQLLGKEELLSFLRALSSKGSSSRGGSNSHLLTPQAMAARSPAVFWSMAHAFAGDISGGVDALRAEL